MNERTRRNAAWIAIAASALGLALAAHFATPTVEEDDSATFALVTLQGKVLVGLERLAPGTVGSQLAPLDDFAASPRLVAGIALLHAELGGERGEAHALDLIDGFGAPDERTPLVRRAIADPGSLSDDARRSLRESLGWFGRLAASRGLEPDDPARRAVRAESMRQIAVFGVMLAAAAAAWIAGLVLCVLAWTRRADGALRASFAVRPGDEALGLESFAVYLAGMFIAQVALPAAGLAAAGLPVLVAASALGLMWPKLRGHATPWAFLGFHRGAGVLREIGAGFVGYLMIVPLFSVGVAIMIALSMAATLLSGDAGSPELVSHPAIVWIAEGNWAVRLGVVAFAAGFAPVFEEAMFRGAFWRGLRPRFGVLASGLGIALIFAAIHPQGWLAIPPLAALAFGFACLREWRDSLIAPMTAHAIHNGALVTAMILSFL